MSINYSVQAEVIDIRTDFPKKDDVFYVDTNVWYWLTYTRASQADRPPAPYQIKDYPEYVNRVLSTNAFLKRSTFSLGELAYRIEMTEYDIYVKNNAEVPKKEFRHNCIGERKAVTAEIETAWGQINQMSGLVGGGVDDVLATAAIEQINMFPIDAYDACVLNLLRKKECVNIITDDGDFASVPGIKVFTANASVLAAAQNQKKLIQR